MAADGEGATGAAAPTGKKAWKISAKLAALRELMKGVEGGPLDAYLVPSEDAHQSEYVALCDQRRAFISDFTGSAGLALITIDDARLWTDGRYFAQAEKELGPDWKLMKVMEDIAVEQWIAQNLRQGARVGADFSTLSVDGARRLEHELHPVKQTLVQVKENLVDKVWGAERPPPPSAPLRVQALEFAGVPVADKLAQLRQKLAAEGAVAIVVSALDEVAWLLNLRGRDVPYNPVFVSYAVVTAERATLYVDKAKITSEVDAHLKASHVEICDYNQLLPDLHALADLALAAASAAAAPAPAATISEEAADPQGGSAATGATKPTEVPGGATTEAAGAAAVSQSTAEAGAVLADTAADEAIAVTAPGDTVVAAAVVIDSAPAVPASEAAAPTTNGTAVQQQQQAKVCKSVWVSGATCSYAVFDRLRQKLPQEQLLQNPSPIALSKALKNATELEGLRACHIRDGVALVEFMCWLDGEAQSKLGAPGYFEEEAAAAAGGVKRKHSEGAAVDAAQEAEGGAPAGAASAKLRGEKAQAGASEPLTEVSVSDALETFRSRQQHYMGPSFATIASVGPNAAIIHYKPEPDTCAQLTADQIFLCDSGGQYLDGTTDVTRTMHFGKPTEHEKKCFTLVLKGYIALEKAVFPNGTTGAVLDVLARTALWMEGLDYRHGTGHGVGSYLNVHEGPHLISFRPRAQSAPLQATMTVTDEPGYYEDGAFGIRTENVLVIRDHKCAHNFGNRGFLAMDPVTFVPIQQKLIEPGLLLDLERQWLDEYHAACRDKLSPLLSGEALQWLHRATQPLSTATAVA